MLASDGVQLRWGLVRGHGLIIITLIMSHMCSNACMMVSELGVAASGPVLCVDVERLLQTLITLIMAGENILQVLLFHLLLDLQGLEHSTGGLVLWSSQVV